jgi:hypothetical protein
MPFDVDGSLIRICVCGTLSSFHDPAKLVQRVTDYQENYTALAAEGLRTSSKISHPCCNVRVILSSSRVRAGRLR